MQPECWPRSSRLSRDGGRARSRRRQHRVASHGSPSPQQTPSTLSGGPPSLSLRPPGGRGRTADSKLPLFQHKEIFQTPIFLTVCVLKLEV
eukprot:3939508-Rhodomonas_salina.2